MKKAIITKINVINLIIEVIEENLRKLRQTIAFRNLFKNGNTYHIDMKIEYYQKSLEKHIERQKNLFEELCKLN